MALTQDELYRDIDDELSWSERDLPERIRTKHVHRLHPYLGKFVPQLVEILLDRYVERGGGPVLDPFGGSGTTLVQSLESGYAAVGVDVAAFNCQLMRAKTARYDVRALAAEVGDALQRLAAFEAAGTPDWVPPFARDWFAPVALAELAYFREIAREYEHRELLEVILARSARSARRTTHFDLDFPRVPQLGEYWCYKHRRTCRPVETARQFLARYATDTVTRVAAFAEVRPAGYEAAVVHGDARELSLGGPFAGVVTSPPYPGLIDYHEQHRYAYELLGLDDRRSLELGAAERGTSRAAIAAYTEGIADVLAAIVPALDPAAPVVIVVDDRRKLYPAILDRAGLELVERYRRHVNRRTGRRAGEFFEDVLVARAA
jgi:hypothetical protein